MLTGRYCSNGIYARTFDTTTEGNFSRYTVTVPRCKLAYGDETNNIQTLLSSNGYETIMSGKWHLTQKGSAYGSFDNYTATVVSTGFTTVASVYYSNMG